MIIIDIELKETLGLILNKISNLEQGQNELRQDFTEMRKDVNELREGQKQLRKDVNELREGQNRINLKLENIIEPRLQLIYENQVNIIEQNKKFEEHEVRIEILETDVFALKNVCKAK